MSTEFKLPQLGENIDSADVAEIMVSEGDVIEPEQAVMELETEKAVVELPCPHGGKVTKIHVSQGDNVKVGATLLTIEEGGGEDEGERGGGGEGEKEKETRRQGDKETGRGEDRERKQPATREKQDRRHAASSASPRSIEGERGRGGEGEREAAEGREGEEVPPPAGPATRRMARELGVDLRHVTGSGKGGRITPEDVQAYVRTLTSGAVIAAAGPAKAPPLPDFSQWGEVERQPLNKIAKAAAQNLSVSWQTIPHVTQHDLADITELEADRKRFTQGAGNGGPKITMTAVVIKAVVAALKEFPHVNASFDAAAGELVLKKYYHIGVAVDTPHGLLVPVVRDVDRKNIIEIATELTGLAEKARNRKLSLDEMQGATFTVTNLGGIGGTAFTPIVNSPEVAILGMSRGRMELQLVDGELKERLMLPLSLSYDHRVVNGADAARFVVKLASDLSDCFQLLIEC